MPSVVGNTTYEALDTEYLEALMVLQEPKMNETDIADAIKMVTCGITVKQNGVRTGVAYLTTGGGQVFLHGYKDSRARFGIRKSIDAGKALCDVVKEAGYAHILCVFKRDRTDVARLVKAIGFTKQVEYKDDDIYKMQLRSIILKGDA